MTGYPYSFSFATSSLVLLLNGMPSMISAFSTMESVRATHLTSSFSESSGTGLWLRPDGFMEGDRFDQMSPGYQDRYEMMMGESDMDDINMEEGGPLARVGLSEDRRGMMGNPMIRMDPSAPRSQQGGSRSVVQGSGSRATWVSPRPFETDEMNVHLGTQGRPLHANLEHWQSPGYSPSRMNLYSEDGGQRPWITKFRTPTNRDSGVTQVRNQGPMEYPIEAGVTATNSPQRRAQMEGGSSGGADPNLGLQMTPPKTIDGGALKTFGFDPDVEYVYLEVSSEGLPVNARVEIWQGPSNTKAIGNIYTDHGMQRPWSALIPLPGYGSSICVRNMGPMTYPIKVSMDPPPKTMM